MAVTILETLKKMDKILRLVKYQPDVHHGGHKASRKTLINTYILQTMLKIKNKF